MKMPADEHVKTWPMTGVEPRWLALVVSVHVALVSWAAFAVHADKTEPVAVMSVQILPMAPPVEQPKPVTPKPQPKSQPQTPKPTVTRVRTAEPVKAAPLPEPKPKPVEETKPEPRKPEPQPEPAPQVIPPRHDAAYLNNPAPVYPQTSRRLGETGTVSMRVLVGPDGKPQEVQVQRGSGFSRLDEAARLAVRKWTFVPAQRGDEKLAGWVTFPIVFNLSDAE